MAYFSNSSISYNISTSSESENEFRNKINYDNVKLNFNKASSPFKTSLASSLSRQTSNNSLRYLKRLKRKSNLYHSKTQLKNEYSAISYSLQPSKVNHNFSDSRNFSNNNKKHTNLKKKKNAKINSIDFNKEFANAFKSSSDSDLPDIKYLKFISKNKEFISSPTSNESIQNKSYSNLKNKKQQTVYSSNNKNNTIFELSTSLTSPVFSQVKTDSVNITNKSVNELNMDEVLSDCSSLSDIVFIRKYDSQSYSTPITDNSFSHVKSLSPKPLPLNISLGISADEPLSQKLSNVTINISDLFNNIDAEDKPNQIEMFGQEHISRVNMSVGTSDELLLKKASNIIINTPDLINEGTENELNQIINVSEYDSQECILNNEHSKVNESKSISDEIIIGYKPEAISNSLKSGNVNCEPSCRLKINIINSSDPKNKRNKKQRKSKGLQKKLLSNTCSTNVLRIMKKIEVKKTRNYCSTTNKTEDIGLEYDTDKDNYMVELSNGILVPAFLSTLKPKYVKKICACGITESEIPSSWNESFHNILHQNIYKLRFKGNIPNNNIINFKQNDLIYKILILHIMNNYNDENIIKSIKDVNDFVSLEYGISKTGMESYIHSTYLAVLPNYKVIGYLEVKHIQRAYTFNPNEPVHSKISVPAKFGISKIWVLIKYRNKNVDINLLEAFCKKKNLGKKDLAFSLDGCQGVEFIQEYTKNKNILIFNDSLA